MPHLSAIERRVLLFEVRSQDGDDLFDLVLSLLSRYVVSRKVFAQVLVMDICEHSYQMDYGAAAANYVYAFFVNTQWEAVAQRLESQLR